MYTYEATQSRLGPQTDNWTLIQAQDAEAMQFDVEMIVVANGQFASRSDPRADRTCTGNANKVDLNVPTITVYSVPYYTIV